MPERSVDPYHDAFRLGAQRKTLDRNPLTRKKPEPGRGARPSTAATAGKESHWGASAAVEWAPIRARPLSAPIAPSEYISQTTRPAAAWTSQKRDFIAMNKAALKIGVTNARDAQRLRDCDRESFRLQERHPKGIRNTKRDTPGPGFVYGKVTVPEVDLGQILAHEPGRKWVEARQEAFKKVERQHKIDSTFDFTQPSTTRSVVLRHASVQIEKPSFRTAKEYRTTKPRVSTFRSEAAANRAQKAQAEVSGNQLSLGQTFGLGLVRDPAGLSRNL